jgi:hypothetical protein
VLGTLAMIGNVHSDNAYTLRFTAAAIAKCAKFYAGHLTSIPYAGFAVLGVPLMFRQKKVWFGIVMFVAMLVPMLVLPGRLFAAYLYVPLIGLAVAMSSITRPAVVVIFFVAWFGWTYHDLRIYRAVTLQEADERRAWFEPVAEYVGTHPEQSEYIFDGSPATLRPAGIEGALTLLRYPQMTHVAPAGEGPRNTAATVIEWGGLPGRVTFHNP